MTTCNTMTFTSDGLQELVDRAAARGERLVRIPAGRYRMFDALHLRAHMRLEGEGKAILEMAPVVSSPLIDIVGYGHSEFRVVDPQLFRPGMGVSITSSIAPGFHTTVARITDQDQETFFIDRPFEHDYRPHEQGRVTSMHSLIAGHDVRDVQLSGLILQGAAGDSGALDGCRGGGVYLQGCREIQIDQVEVRDYPGDAISYQQCVDLWIRNCHLHHNAGHGMHPGSGSVRYIIQANRVTHNGGCGIFYCFRTTHSICRQNLIASNGASGISIGERDTDHLLEGNDLRDNAHAGLKLRTPVIEGADRLVIRANCFHTNQRSAGGAELEIAANLRDVHVLENQFDSSRAIDVGPGCERIVLDGNKNHGKPLVYCQEDRTAVGDPPSALLPQRPVPEAAIPSGRDDWNENALNASAVRAQSSIATARASSVLSVGPGLLPLTGARHLRIARLDPWSDRSLEK